MKKYEIDVVAVLSKKGTVTINTSLSNEQLEAAISAATEVNENWDLLSFVMELNKFEGIKVEKANNGPLQIDDFDITNIKEI